MVSEIKKYSQSGITLWILGAAVLAGLLCVAAGFASWAGGHRDAPAREITLVAKGTRWNGSNPEIRVARGEKVRLVIRNEEDVPVIHNFALSGIGTTGTLQPGESVEIPFHPTRAGEYVYWCPLHPGMMAGKIVVAE
jgi:plastocyanin